MLQHVGVAHMHWWCMAVLPIGLHYVRVHRRVPVPHHGQRAREHRRARHCRAALPCQGQAHDGTGSVSLDAHLVARRTHDSHSSTRLAVTCPFALDDVY